MATGQLKTAQQPVDPPFPRWGIALFVLCSSVLFGVLNIQNAKHLAPNWGQDLAFFHQLVHSAANGGPWASPLLLEPQGFFEMVHTHLILPVVVLAYRFVPRQETLLFLHAFLASLTLWPTIRLGEQCGGRRLGLFAGLALIAFGPFQAVATADFRLVILAVPSIVGCLTSLRQGNIKSAMAWAALGWCGRQDIAYMTAAVGFALILIPWGGRRQWRGGAVLLVSSALVLLLWTIAKEEMFFHINPMSMPTSIAVGEELRTHRIDFLLRLGRSGTIFGLLSPAALAAALPSAFGMATSLKEWHLLVGPGAHHHVFWLPFAIVAGTAGVARLPRDLGPIILLALNTISFPWVPPRSGPEQLMQLIESIPEDSKVAADYDTIHRLAGRSVLWNTAQFSMSASDRPRAWSGEWPLPIGSVDHIIARSDDPVLNMLDDTWRMVDVVGNHLLMQRTSSSHQDIPTPAPHTEDHSQP